MFELEKSFNKIKNVIYKKNESVRTLEDLVIFIQKEKTKKDLETISKLKLYVRTMLYSMNDLGTEIISINNRKNNIDEKNELLKKNYFNEYVKSLVFIIDQFADGLSAIVRTIDFQDEYFEMKKTEIYVKNYRESLIKKLREYKLKITINEEDFNKFIFVMNDVINVIIQEAYKLRLTKLYEVLSRNYG